MREWKTLPIGPTCEYWTSIQSQCRKPAVIAYPAMGGGWCALCLEHGQKHLPEARFISELLRKGETLQSITPTGERQ